jgi:hypothetical protein
MSQKKFHELTPQEVKLSILNDPDFLLEKEIYIAEADIFLCRYKGNRFNIKFDIVYGTEVEPLSEISKTEAKKIENTILDSLPP